MDAAQAIDRACRESTLLDALSWIAVWESERAIRQAKRFFETGERTGHNPTAGWDTCFGYLFGRVMKRWGART